MFSSSVKLLVLGSSFVLIGAAAAPAAPQKTQKSSAGVQRSDSGKHCLWRVTNTKAPVYLLGSIHSMRKKDYPLPAVIEQTIQESQQFYFEYNPRGDEELAKKLTAAAVLPKGVLLKQKINPKTWHFLLALSTKKNYAWAGLRAWAVAMF